MIIQTKLNVAVAEAEAGAELQKLSKQRIDQHVIELSRELFGETQHDVRPRSISPRELFERVRPYLCLN